MKREPSLHRGPVAWMARHGIAPNLFMAFLIIGGFIMSLTIKKEFIPSYEADTVIVDVAYAGATPAEMEQSIILPIENEVASLDGIKDVTSIANSSSARVVFELSNGVDRQKAYQDIEQAVSRITTFPVETEKPVIRLASRSIDVATLAVYGDVSLLELKRLAEQIKEQLLTADEISKIELKGTPSEEIHIEISQANLQRYNLSLAEVANTISKNAIEQSAGSVRTEGGEILVTLNDRRYWAPQFRDIVLRHDASGILLQLADVATIKEGFSDSNRSVTYNGKVAIGLKIYRAEDQTPTTVVEAMYEKLDVIRDQLPLGIEIIVTDDDGETYQQRVGLLLKNATIGLILVLLLLSIFLEYRLAFWVTMGIPTAFLGSLLLLPLFDVSINMISMFAFIIALGIVVDDAIIAGENIYEHMQKGIPFLNAAIIGAREVSVPLAFAILTNVVAFLPLLALPGMMGKLFLAIPIVVICCFIISWIEALFILPTHLAALEKNTPGRFGRFMNSIQKPADKKLHDFIHLTYKPVLHKCLQTPSLVIAVSLAIAIVVLSYPMSGRMGFSMFPRLEGEYVVAKVELAANAPFSEAKKVRQYLEQTLRQVTDPIEAQGTPLVLSIEGDITDSSIEIEARLVPTEVRPINANDVVGLWREAIGEIPGIRSLTFDAERGGGPSGGAGLTLELRGSNNSDSLALSEELIAEMATLTGVVDLASSYTNGKPQWEIELNSAGRSLGLDASSVSTQVRNALYGARALRQQRDSNEVTALVRLPLNERMHAADIKTLLIKTPAGGYVPLADIAYLNKQISPSQIRRRDGNRIITITAEVEPRKMVPGVMSVLREDIFPQLQEKYPDIEIGFRGRQADTKDTLNSLMVYGAFSLLLIYSLLAIPFKSYSQPILVMAIIPFGAVGAILGHLILGEDLSIMSIMGIVALAGVVVNDSLILVDYANKKVAEGLSNLDAIVEAGVRRFRPILLTTLTTFGGLAPMVFETSRQAQFITPMAVSLGFGILFTTFVCLLILPACYLILGDFLVKKGVEKLN
ncbi:MAG: efflux RND transporter permease subunit [Oleispira sp.]